jgi:hypothetical protein
MASLADFALLPLERSLVVRQVVANLISGLMAIGVILAIEPRHEGVHYRVAMNRAAVISQLNHDIRNAVFPDCIALQKTGDPESNRIADRQLSASISHLEMQLPMPWRVESITPFWKTLSTPDPRESSGNELHQAANHVFALLSWRATHR